MTQVELLNQMNDAINNGIRELESIIRQLHGGLTIRWPYGVTYGRYSGEFRLLVLDRPLSDLNQGLRADYLNKILLYGIHTVIEENLNYAILERTTVVNNLRAALDILRERLR